ncbi:MAG: hypothetical protein EP330_09150 [Deltaproteobacteria bacterium]|nr:MAG: hypothetical protein EP330_09150 [Deltaproteobacteria bacterium]
MNRFIGLSAVLALTALTACSGGNDPDSGTPDPCDINSVEETFPANGATAYYRTTIEATLDDADTAATLEVEGVTGTTEIIEERVVFTPDSPLDSSTTYTATVNYTGEDGNMCPVEFSFTTSEVGSSIDATGLTGNTYNLDLASGRFVEPAGVGSLLGEYLDGTTLFLNVASASATEIQMVGALGDDAGTAQDVCSPTIDFPPADFSGNPYFEVNAEGQTTTISVEGIDIQIEDLIVSGAFAPDGTYIAGGVLAGRIDTRPLVDLVEEGGAEDAICELAAGIGVECEDCGGGEIFCLSLYVDNLSAVQENVSVEAQSDPCVNHAADCPTECPA